MAKEKTAVGTVVCTEGMTVSVAAVMAGGHR